MEQHAEAEPQPERRTQPESEPAGSDPPPGRERRPGSIRRTLKVPGPGIVTGAADDDPSGIATYAQAGALYGAGLLWTVPVTLPLMIMVQEACERMTWRAGTPSAN